MRETWMTASEIAQRYVVGEARLLEYASRGNLPIRHEAGGQASFDERVVARFFRRDQGPGNALPASAAHFGRLGTVKLGQPETVRARRSDDRGREASGQFAIVPELSPPRRTGTAGR